MTKIETWLESIATELNNIRNMLRRIFVAISEDNQVNNAPTTSTDNNNNTSLWP